VRFHGMTDRAIIRGGLERLGLAADEATIDAICATYLAALAEEMPRSEGFRLCPGVREVLERLADRDAIAVGLGTGNLREGARIKLEHAGWIATSGSGASVRSRASPDDRPDRRPSAARPGWACRSTPAAWS